MKGFNLDKLLDTISEEAVPRFIKESYDLYRSRFLMSLSLYFPLLFLLYYYFFYVGGLMPNRLMFYSLLVICFGFPFVLVGLFVSKFFVFRNRWGS